MSLSYDDKLFCDDLDLDYYYDHVFGDNEDGEDDEDEETDEEW